LGQRMEGGDRRKGKKRGGGTLIPVHTTWENHEERKRGAKRLCGKKKGKKGWTGKYKGGYETSKKLRWGDKTNLQNPRGGL